MTILIADAFDSVLPDKLAAFGSVTDDIGQLADADVVLVRSKTKCTKEWIDKAPKLKLIIRGGVGIDNIDKEYAESRGITVCNTPKASSIAVAELAFAMLCAVPARLVDAHNSMAAGEWKKSALKRTELYGKKICLLGLGNIAVEMAKRCSAFGMEVQAFRRSNKSSNHAEVVGDIGQAVAGMDYISMHLPLTDSTRNIVNADLIDKMKDGVVIVNTGRGDCVDAQAMNAALESGKVACYATDVWPSDPPPADYPLLKAPNMLMAPHIGAGSKENLARIGAEAEAIIADFIK